ncbi:hypothetical protein SCLCIDRAFT_31489 [Scleroderma citrinum Foug A]|uniref:Uncharacterized protein n=1 Tax=Scleroderma citrinum Foug A TaxID=1036808 RepID=A0A0C2YWD4_9AGAM|nr:hypothetical protein SCLCIDRAFT_31489 [Scleroderma citrinum Foug A]
MADPGQDFAMVAISKLSQGKKDTCIVGDGWTGSPGAQDNLGEGDGGMAEEEEEEEMVLDEDGEGRRNDSHEPGEIIEGYGMEPGHSGAGTMDVPSRPPSLSLQSAGHAANHSTPLLPLNTSDSAMSEHRSISLNSPKLSVPPSFGASPGSASYFPASSHRSNQDPMHESPVSSGPHSPATTSPSIQASNLFGDMEIGNTETSLMMSVFSTHAKKATGSASLGKGKQPMSSKGARTHTSASPVNSQGSSCKCSHDVATDISTKINDTSDVLLCHIQEGTGTKVEVKRLKYEATHQYRELKAREQCGEREHELRLIMENNQHSLTMASSENDRLKLELELERLRICRLELELVQGSPSGGASAAGSLLKQSKCQNLLQTLKSAKLDLQLARYFDLVQAALRMIEDSDSDSDPDSDMSPPSPITSMSSMSSIIITDLESLLASSEGTPYLTLD